MIEVESGQQYGKITDKMNLERDTKISNQTNLKHIESSIKLILAHLVILCC